MSRHKFKNKRLVDADMCAKVPGLAELLTPADKAAGLEVLSCASGCGYSELPLRYTFWVDFGRGIIQHDTRNTTCGAAGTTSGTSIGTTSGSTKPLVTHPRVDVSASIASFGASLSVPESSVLKDERFARFIPESKRATYLTAHETPPTNFKDAITRIQIMIAEQLAALCMGSAAFMASQRALASSASSSASASNPAPARASTRGSGQATSSDGKVPCTIMLSQSKAPGTTYADLKKRTIDPTDLERNKIDLAIMSRGCSEYLTYANAVAWSGSYGSVKAVDIMREVHDTLLYDLSVVIDALKKGLPCSTPLESSWDSSPFFILGLLCLKGDESGLAAFYRTERTARFDHVCKKLGWKPDAGGSPSIKGSGGGSILGKRGTRDHDGADKDDDGEDAASGAGAAARGTPTRRDQPKKRGGPPPKRPRFNAKADANKIKQLQEQVRKLKAAGTKQGDKGDGGADR